MRGKKQKAWGNANRLLFEISQEIPFLRNSTYVRWTDGPTDGRIDGHTLLQKCVVASKKKGRQFISRQLAGTDLIYPQTARTQLGSGGLEA